MESGYYLLMTRDASTVCESEDIWYWFLQQKLGMIMWCNVHLRFYVCRVVNDPYPVFAEDPHHTSVHRHLYYNVEKQFGGLSLMQLARVGLEHDGRHPWVQETFLRLCVGEDKLRGDWPFLPFLNSVLIDVCDAVRDGHANICITVQCKSGRHLSVCIVLVLVKFFRWARIRSDFWHYNSSDRRHQSRLCQSCSCHEYCNEGHAGFKGEKELMQHLTALLLSNLIEHIEAKRLYQQWSKYNLDTLRAFAEILDHAF